MLDKSKSKRRPSADKTARAPASHAAKIKSDESSDEKEKVTTTSIEGDKNPRDNEGEEDMEELDIGLLVSQALEGNFHILFEEISQLFHLNNICWIKFPPSRYQFKKMNILLKKM